MPNPTKFEKGHDYSENPDTTKTNTQLDIDFENIQQSIAETVDALADVRRSDGKLANHSVSFDSLDPEAASALTSGAVGSATAAMESATEAMESAVSAAASEQSSLQIKQELEILTQSILTTRFDSVAHVQSALVNKLVKSVHIPTGDGRTLEYFRVDDEPLHQGKLRSADRFLPDGSPDVVNGGWWVRRETAVSVISFGADSTGQYNCQPAFQSAINYIQHIGGGLLMVPSGHYQLADTVYIPSGISIIGEGRHPILREYGDSTAGVMHPRKGTLITTQGAGVAKLFTDESGDGTDAPVKVAFAIMGECITLTSFTLQTGYDNDNWDVGILVCGVSRCNFDLLDVRGGWTKGAQRWDATWGRANERMMALDHTPGWFDSDYAELYEYGLTNNMMSRCRLEGGKAFSVESGPNNAQATNGISDSHITDCEFHNDYGSATRSERQSDSGATIRLNYRLDGLGGGQGLCFSNCRFDCRAKWLFDIDHWSNLDIVGGRQYAETSSAWQAIQEAAGKPEEEWRGRIRVSSANSTGPFRLDGEFHAAIAIDGVGKISLADLTVSDELGRRWNIVNPTGLLNTANIVAQGWGDDKKLQLHSFAGNGRVSFVNREEGLETYLHIEKDKFIFPGNFHFTHEDLALPALSVKASGLFSDHVLTETTASGANININPSTGQFRLSVSSEQFKDSIEPIDENYSQVLVDQAVPIWYRSTSTGDNPKHSFWGFSAEQVAKIDPRLVHWKYGENVKIGEKTDVNGSLEPLYEYRAFDKPKPWGVAYERFVPHLVVYAKRLQTRIADLEKRLSMLEG